jgi:hypothetical protein
MGGGDGGGGGGDGERWVVCSDKPFMLITGWFAL